MKGITPVIAIILLLLITISMVGFAFVWFQRVATTATNSADTQLQNQLNTQAQTIAIDNVDDTNNKITIRHTGTVATDTSKVSIYVSSAIATCTWDVPGSWAPGVSKTCTVAAGFACTGSTKIDATGPGNRDSSLC